MDTLFFGYYSGGAANSSAAGLVIAPLASSTNGIHMDASGNVGIGISYSSGKLDVAEVNARILTYRSSPTAIYGCGCDPLSLSCVV